MRIYDLFCNFPGWPLFIFKTPFSEQLARPLLRGISCGPSSVEGPLIPSPVPWQEIQERCTFSDFCLSVQLLSAKWGGFRPLTVLAWMA